MIWKKRSWPISTVLFWHSAGKTEISRYSDQDSNRVPPEQAYNLVASPLHHSYGEPLAGFKARNSISNESSQLEFELGTCTLERDNGLRCITMQRESCNNASDLHSEVSGSSFGCDAEYPVCLRLFPLVPQFNFREHYLKLGYDRYLPHPFQFIIHYHPIICSYK
jgi:hypothetical protein